MSFFRIFFYRRVGDLGFLHNASVVSCLSTPLFSLLLLFPTLSISTHLCPNHSSFLHSSLLPSTFSPYPILFLTLLTPLPPANAYRLQGHIHRPLRSHPASTSYRVSGGEYLQSPRFQCSCKLWLCLTHAPCPTPTSMIPVVT